MKPAHAEQSTAALKAGKHVQVEIPLCDRLEDGKAVVEAQKKSGRVAMVGHTRRFNPSHQYVHKNIAAIREGREPNSSVAKVLACYEVLDGLERQLEG